jgi:hypothetical protein
VRALSLWQPWASLWLSPRKICETRHWSINVPREGFWLAVHATKKIVRAIDPKLEGICNEQFGNAWRLNLPTGALIGRVHVVCCLPTESSMDCDSDDFFCGNYGPGRFIFRRDEYRLLRSPISINGRQSFFSVPDWDEALETAP